MLDFGEGIQTEEKENQDTGRSQKDWDLASPMIRHILSECVQSLASQGHFSAQRAREYQKSGNL